MKRLFIANRGEICRRIAITAKTLGIETVTFSSPKPPRFLDEVIDKFVIKEDLSPAHYLDLDTLISDAKNHDCDAIHPGYGFASEQAEFVEKTQKAGLTWVGPNANAIRVMADKATARTKAIDAGVPCSVGVELKELDHNKITEAAEKIGFPMLIKAAFGGGGRGMRRVENTEQLHEQLPKAAREAKQSFGNDTLILEAYLTEARHIEVQILGDTHGHVLVIGDRDCSMQRRHQKVIEEAPAPGLPDEIRKLLHDSSLQLAKAVHYESAGTIEFLVSLTPKPRCFFLEMNTRLQVEHPVSEEVYGLDLVKWQLKIAQGASLPLTPPQPRGHAIEVRIYAEDDEFRPTPGPIHSFQPYLAPGVRWDIGIEPGQVINSLFDPMIAKVISYNEDRSSCIHRLEDALKNTFLAGTKHNISMLQTLLAHQTFQDLNFSTQFIQNEHEDLKNKISNEHQKFENTSKNVFEKIHHHGPKPLLPVQSASDVFQSIFHPEKQLSTLHNRRLFKTSDESWEETGRFYSPENKQSFYYRAAHYMTDNGLEVTVHMQGQHYIFRDESSTHQQETSDFDGTIRAPVPGLVTSVKAIAGDQITEGDQILSLESMKIECEVRAPKSGTITHIAVKEGDQLKPDQILVTMDIEED
ncbi:MAG: biotin carboxylase N-terminal domain-containing protein [Oligoflexales bacterium]